ncbi:hypothetical protein Bca4012_030350 [Brassica carinata]|uniref:(rape) hypothetical protein n=1 Tax=Brassica napus TaxID=3708 RepID=A0A816J9A3_BRANA|nr:unnamed protein product [Brassica napus]
MVSILGIVKTNPEEVESKRELESPAAHIHSFYNAQPSPLSLSHSSSSFLQNLLLYSTLFVKVEGVPSCHNKVIPEN